MSIHLHCVSIDSAFMDCLHVEQLYSRTLLIQYSCTTVLGAYSHTVQLYSGPVLTQYSCVQGLSSHSTAVPRACPYTVQLYWGPVFTQYSCISACPHTVQLCSGPVLTQYSCVQGLSSHSTAVLRACPHTVHMYLRTVCFKQLVPRFLLHYVVVQDQGSVKYT